MDLLEERVEAARLRVPGADVRRADAGRLPFGEAGFELVLMVTALSSVGDRGAVGRVLAEARRVLAPRGLAVVYEPALPNPMNRATRRISREELTALGPEASHRRLTALPPLVRRLGPLAPRAYPALSRVVPTHYLSSHRR